jgi:hypothetical protein
MRNIAASCVDSCEESPGSFLGGGGLWVHEPFRLLILSALVVIENQAGFTSIGHGGGLAFTGMEVNASLAALVSADEQVKVLNNSATGGGGGMYYTAAVGGLSRVRVLQNQALYGQDEATEPRSLLIVVNGSMTTNVGMPKGVIRVAVVDERGRIVKSEQEMPLRLTVAGATVSEESPVIVVGGVRRVENGEVDFQDTIISAVPGSIVLLQAEGVRGDGKALASIRRALHVAGCAPGYVISHRDCEACSPG